jgi:hypothetical protein
MLDDNSKLTRRDFIKTTGTVALGAAVGLPAMAQETTEEVVKSKVVLVRNPDAVGKEGKLNGEILHQMMDEAVTTLFGNEDPIACWKQIIKPEDIVGIKSNVWRYLPTPADLEQYLKKRVMDAGVPDKNIDIDDRGVLDKPIFKEATALLNIRPMRTHAWSGVGSLIKNYIMFVPYPQNYHGNSCAYLGAVWTIPATVGRTRLNVLVMLTPQFHTAGPHHYDDVYTWTYGGLLVSTDPVAADTIGLKILQAQRKLYFGEDKPLKPVAHHIAFADTKYNLGTSDMNKIDLIRLGWDEGILI